MLKYEINLFNLKNSTKILITGGTGSFGKAFLKEIIRKKSFERIVFILFLK